MQLSELVAQVEENIGRDDKTDEIPSYINLALQRIQEDHVFHEWERTSYREIDPRHDDIDPRRIPLPENLAQIRLISYVNGSKGRNLERLTREEYDQKFSSALTSPEHGEPKYYTIWGQYFEVYPVPEDKATYYIRWLQEPYKLEYEDDIDDDSPDNVSSEPRIPYDNLIIECATMIAYSRLGLTEENMEQHQIYNSYLNSAIRKDTHKYSDNNYKLEGYNPGPQLDGLSHRRDKIF